jgi:MFS family permease
MASVDTTTQVITSSERRWSLAAAIASVTVFGLSIGQIGPLLSLILELRGTDVTVNGLNAGIAFIGVVAGPMLAPDCVRRLGIRNFLLACFVIDIVTILSLKIFTSVAAWFVLRVMLGLVGSSIFTTSEAWINHLAGDAGRGRIIGIYAAALSAGFGIGPLLLSVTGITGWLPFLANAAITAIAALPLLGIGNISRGFGQERGAHPLAMFARAPVIVTTVALFGLYEAAVIALLPIWGVRTGLNPRLAAATVSAVYIGSVVMQTLIGWISDKWSRLAVLRLCCVVGLGGVTLMALLAPGPPLLLCLLFVWGGIGSGIYPVALSMAGDRFRGADLVAVNAAMIVAYGLGGLVGPALGGAAMDIWHPQDLLWLFVAVFVCLMLATVPRAASR